MLHNYTYYNITFFLFSFVIHVYMHLFFWYCNNSKTLKSNNFYCLADPNWLETNLIDYSSWWCKYDAWAFTNTVIKKLFHLKNSRWLDISYWIKLFMPTITPIEYYVIFVWKGNIMSFGIRWISRRLYKNSFCLSFLPKSVFWSIFICCANC